MEKMINNRKCGVLVATVAIAFLVGMPAASAQSKPAASPTLKVAHAASAPKPEVSPLAGYNRGFFLRSADGGFRLKIGGRVQARYAAEILDGQANQGAFSIPRARLVLSGNVFGKALSYKFQTDFSKGSATLKDFFFDYAFNKEVLRLRVGQLKRPFSRQQLNSSSRLDLVDRAITDRAFGAGRDIGILIHNGQRPSGFEYAFGVFNGTGDKGVFSGSAKVDPTTGEGSVTGKVSNIPRRFHPELVARVAYNHGGIAGYREADFKKGSLRFAVGASGSLDLDWDKDDASAIRGEIDAIAKIRGFSTSGALYISSKQTGGGFGDQSRDAVGFHLQASYLIGKRVLPAVRFAMVKPKGADNDQQELMGGLTVFFNGHRFKWQTDGGVLRMQVAGAKTLNNILIRTQGQVSF